MGALTRRSFLGKCSEYGLGMLAGGAIATAGALAAPRRQTTRSCWESSASAAAVMPWP